MLDNATVDGQSGILNEDKRETAVMLGKRIRLRALYFAPIGLAVAIGAASASVVLPPLKDGWWQTTSTTHTVTVGQAPAPDTTDVTYNCENAASWELGLKALTAGVPGCAMDIEGSGSNYTMTMNCKNLGGGGGTVTSIGDIEYIGDAGLHMVSDVKSDMPSIQMNETDHTVEDTKWLGECPTGVVPGDYGTMKNGVFVKSFNALTK